MLLLLLLLLPELLLLLPAANNRILQKKERLAIVHSQRGEKATCFVRVVKYFGHYGIGVERG